MNKYIRIFVGALVGLTLTTSVAACGSGADPQEKQAKAEATYTAETQKKLRGKIGNPNVEDSLELRNLKSRYELLDDAEKIGYVYLIDHGNVFAEYTIKGKVSSLNSQFTASQQIIDNCDSSCGGVTLDQAEADGSYGENPEGIFFFTTDGVYVEWAGNYQYSDQRLELSQPVIAVATKEVK